MAASLGDRILSPGGHFATSAVISSTLTRYPFNGMGVTVTAPTSSQTRNDLLCQVFAVLIYSAPLAGFLLIKNHAGVDQFRLAYPIVTGQLYVPLGSGVLIPSGIAFATTNDNVIYTVMYRRLTGKKA